MLLKKEELMNYKLIHKAIVNDIIKTVEEDFSKAVERDIQQLYSISSMKLFKKKVFAANIGCLYSIKKTLNIIDESLSCEEILWETFRNIPEDILCKNCLFKVENQKPSKCMDGLNLKFYKSHTKESFIELLKIFRDYSTKEE